MVGDKQESWLNAHTATNIKKDGWTYERGNVVTNVMLVTERGIGPQVNHADAHASDR